MRPTNWEPAESSLESSSWESEGHWTNRKTKLKFNDYNIMQTAYLEPILIPKDKNATNTILGDCRGELLKDNFGIVLFFLSQWYYFYNL